LLKTAGALALFHANPEPVAVVRSYVKSERQSKRGDAKNAAKEG
jgi:hypothetical protein